MCHLSWTCTTAGGTFLLDKLATCGAEPASLLCRHLEAPLPGDKLALTVAVSHPEHGSYFTATLRGQLSSQPGLRNEQAGLAVLWR